MGQFISFEGAEAAGKSTQLRLLAARLEAAGCEVIRAREPGGTALGERLRELILPGADTTNDPTAELLLLNAARAQLVAEVIRPALQRGAVVLVDRYADATLAYQGYGRGGDLVAMRTVIRIATHGLQPHRTVLLDVPSDVSAARLATRGAQNFFDRMGADFQAKVRAGYLELARQEPERWLVIRGVGSVEEVALQIWDALAPLFVRG